MTSSIAAQTSKTGSTSSTDQDLTAHTIHQILPHFDRALKSYALFQLFFVSLASAEAVLLILFFPFLYKSSLIAFGLAFFILTLFLFMVGRQYLMTQKVYQLEDLKIKFLQASTAYYKGQKESPDSYRHLAEACVRFAEKLQGREYTYLKAPAWLNNIGTTIEKLSCYLHWKDVHRMKEMLLLAAVEQHINGVKAAPTSLEAHSDLAHAYVILSGLYYDPRKIVGYDSDRWIPGNKYNDMIEHNFRITAQRAIEELKIVSEYAPDDPWVHQQLAYSYHDLQLPEEEIKEYEVVLNLKPGDPDILFKLGTLYFKQGQNGKGLRIFEHLRKMDPKRSEQLITHYGAYHGFRPLTGEENE